ncbi:MAG TPA: hypothetical protein VNJ04_02505 [Gemmatimonadaceae bacterium]|nr:hypothetical protein [Gemmatimonadaceae bacterium]
MTRAQLFGDVMSTAAAVAISHAARRTGDRVARLAQPRRDAAAEEPVAPVTSTFKLRVLQ